MWPHWTLAGAQLPTRLKLTRVFRILCNGMMGCIVVIAAAQGWCACDAMWVGWEAHRTLRR